MKRRLRVPRALVFVVTSGAIATALGTSCKGDEECVRCIADPRVGDAGVDADPVECPACLPEDGVCPVGCIPEGYV